MKTILFSLLVLTLFVPLSWGTEWVRYGGDAEGNTWFYDNSSIERDGSIIKVKKKLVLSEKQKLNIAKTFEVEPKSLSYYIFQDEVDCKTKTIRGLSTVLFFQDGSKVYEHSIPTRWESPAPGSILEILYNKMCGMRY